MEANVENTVEQTEAGEIVHPTNEREEHPFGGKLVSGECFICYPGYQPLTNLLHGRFET